MPARTVAWQWNCEKSGQILVAASQWFVTGLLKEVTYLTQKFIDLSETSPFAKA